MSELSLNQWDELSDKYCDTILTPFSNLQSTNAFLSLISKEDITGCILDAGCGNGYFLDLLVSKFHISQKPYALDMSKKMLMNTSVKIGDAVHVIQSGIEHLPLSDNSFDSVFAINSVLSENRSLRGKCFLELYRVLSTNKKIIFLFPALESYWEQLHIVREQFITDGMSEDQAVWEVYNISNERLFDPIGGYVTIENTSMRIKLYTHWEIGQFLSCTGFREISISKYWYPKEHCVQMGMICGENGLFDWFVTARK